MKAAFCLCGKLVVLARTLECATTLICLSVRCKQWVGKFGSLGECREQCFVHPRLSSLCILSQVH